MQSGQKDAQKASLTPTSRHILNIGFFLYIWHKPIYRLWNLLTRTIFKSAQNIFENVCRWWIVSKFLWWKWPRIIEFKIRVYHTQFINFCWLGESRAILGSSCGIWGDLPWGWVWCADSGESNLCTRSLDSAWTAHALSNSCIDLAIRCHRTKSAANPCSRCKSS